ncbi:MAG: M48 family metalloprotease [Beijerinckiaceae bacterium]|nr:M48 family metalloprotease [Beijerinckiaceae bacterium]
MSPGLASSTSPRPPHGRRAGALCALFGAALLLAACASDAIVPLPPEKPSQLNAPRQVDAASAAEHRRLLAAFNGEYRAPAAQALIDETVTRLANATERPDLHYRVTILNTGRVNAFALPTGYIYVTRGLLALANDTSELSSVLAHEMAHVTARHAVERAELERRSVLVSKVNSDLLNDPQAGQVRQDQGRVAIASFSRQQELEADQISVRTVAKAGFDPYGPTRFLQSLGRSSVLRGRQGDRTTVDFLATHPATPERVQAALLAARQIGAPQSSEANQAERNRYLAAINGMIFGDDPADGLVRGSKFVHPRLGFAFSAPDGFQLENSADAVLGIKENGQQALRFESIKLPQGMTIDDYLKTSPIPEAPTTNIEPITVGGIQGATALANSNDWTYRFAVLQSGPRAYRMILAAQSYTPEVDQQFRKSIATYHTPTAEELAGTKPQKLAIVIAQAGDTAQSLASRMAGERDRALERFAILNGLEDDQTIKPGTRYKIITQ